MRYLPTTIYRKSCKGCSDRARSYHYEDSPNGLGPVHICKEHLLKRAVKYYPGSELHKAMTQ